MTKYHGGSPDWSQRGFRKDLSEEVMMEMRSAGETKVTWVRRKWNNITKKGAIKWNFSMARGTRAWKTVNEIWALSLKGKTSIWSWEVVEDQTRKDPAENGNETSLNSFRQGQDTIKFFILKWSSQGIWGFRGGASGKEPTCQSRRSKRHGFSPWVRKIPWRRAWQPTPVFLLRESHRQRSLVGYSPWGHTELDMKQLSMQYAVRGFSG